MKLENFIKSINEDLEILIKEKDSEIKTLTENNYLLNEENQYLSEELSHYRSTKLGKLVQTYYKLLETSPLIKAFLKFLLFLFSFVLAPLRFITNNKVEIESINQNDYLSEEIIEIIRESPFKKVIFFIAPVVWDIPLYQRPQHIAYYLSKQKVLYFYLVKEECETAIKEVSPNCYEIRMKGLDFDYLTKIVKETKGREVFLHTYSTELKDINSLIDVFKRHKAKVIYEYIDEISEHIAGMKIPEHVVRTFERLVRDEDDTYFITSATRLFEDALYYRKKKLALITNGVEYEHFSQKFEKKDLPFEMLRIFSQNKPIIGYYGAIASWMDYELIKYLASKKPNYNFVIIGLDYDGSVSKSGLEQYSNIYVLPPVHYKKLPRYAYFFDICTIPFKINEITLSTSPIKLFEYMALKKPIVTTAMPECKKYKSVLIGETYEDFLKKIDKGLSLSKDVKYLSLLEKEAKENTWESKAQEIIKLIDS